MNLNDLLDSLEIPQHNIPRIETPKFDVNQPQISADQVTEIYAMRERDYETARQYIQKSEQRTMNVYDALVEQVNQKHDAILSIANHTKDIDSNVADLKSDVSSIEKTVSELNDCVESLKSELAEERARAEEAEKSAKWFGFWCGIGAVVLTILLQWAFDTFIEPALSNHFANAAIITVFHFLF